MHMVEHLYNVDTKLKTCLLRFSVQLGKALAQSQCLFCLSAFSHHKYYFYYLYSQSFDSGGYVRKLWEDGGGTPNFCLHISPSWV